MTDRPELRSTTEIELDLVTLFETIFRGAPVLRQWASLSGLGHYSPRVDVAVGPFAAGDAQLAETYDEMLGANVDAISRLLDHYRDNLYRHVAHVDGSELPPSVPSVSGIRMLNRNARCFLAIEVERTGSRKHMLGGTINASALGRLGLMVAYSEQRMRALLRILQYSSFLRTVGKPTFDYGNLLVVSPAQLESAFA